ncbi:MAG TPA: hypothetical protein VFQ90_05805 [Stellaceae bacterium]|nr:hypothetical protein [Stellaceae bacterium]
MRRARRTPLWASTCAILIAAAVPGNARADFKVHLPDAEAGEFEIETVGSYGRSGNPDTNNEQSFVHELEYGVNNWWRTGLEFETGRDPGPNNHLKFNQMTWENWLVLGERGEYWMDSALFAEYGHVMLNNMPDEVTIGPIFRKEFLGTANTVNLFFSHDIGPHAAGQTDFIYAWETRVMTGWLLEPGFQAYGQPGPVGHFVSLGQQDHRIGPQVFGEIHNLGPGTLVFNGGVLFGLTPAAARQTFRWQLEYEVHF